MEIRSKKFKDYKWLEMVICFLSVYLLQEEEERQ